MSDFDRLNADFHRQNNQLRLIQEEKSKQDLQRYYHENPVAGIRSTIEDQIKAFEATLGEDYVLGAWLASFGNQILIIVEKIQFSEPALVIFHGQDQDGNKLQLIQHASQLNLLLNAVKKAPDQPQYKVGFVTD